MSSVIEKIIECQDLTTKFLGITHPFLKLCITYGIFNHQESMLFLKSGFNTFMRSSRYLGHVSYGFLFKHKIPVKKTFELKYIGI